jgi:hypothetical protein
MSEGSIGIRLVSTVPHLDWDSTTLHGKPARIIPYPARIYTDSGKTCISEPDPNWIRIQSGQWIQDKSITLFDQKNIQFFFSCKFFSSIFGHQIPGFGLDPDTNPDPDSMNPDPKHWDKLPIATPCSCSCVVTSNGPGRAS